MSLSFLGIKGAAHLLAVERLHACAVCFGKSDNPNLPRAFTWGIFFLIVPIFFILAAFVYALYRMERARAPAKT